MTRSQRFTLIATIIGSGIAFLDSTVVNLALPSIAEDLGASFSDLQWIVDGYFLSLSALILLGGSLGDIFGRKRVYQIGLAGFGVTSLVCALAPNAQVLIAMRVVQGVFGALLTPGAMAIINTNFAAKDRGGAIGSWAGWSAVFPAIGPLVGGFLIDVASWRWIFLINLPLVAVCYVLGSIGIKESRDASVRRVDFRGASIAMLALAGLTYGLIEGPAGHWQIGAIVALSAGFLLSGAFIYAEKRAKDPMVPLGLFNSRNFAGANLMTLAMYGALGGFFFALVIYLQTTLHYPAIKAGLSLLPVTILLLLFSKRVGKWSAEVGPRWFMTLGPLISSVGIAWMLRLGPHTSSFVFDVLPGVMLFSIGLAIFVAPLTSTVMGSVSENSSGIASGISNAVARSASLIVVALLGLFGSDDVFRFAMILCATLAAIAGIISFLMIKNPPRPKVLKAKPVL